MATGVARGARAALAARAPLALAGMLLIAVPGVRPPPAGASDGRPAPPRAWKPAPALSTAPGAGTTLVATLRGTEVRYSSPGGPAVGLVPAAWYGVRSTVPVIAARPGWVRVRLARRPNGSTAWLRAADVVLSTTPYRIVIDLATAHLALYERGRAVFTAPAGLGTRSDPTPAGSFFVAFFEKPPGNEPGYGPFIIVTSAHSDMIGDWARSGDAVIGIHGPLGGGSEIGTAGAFISHGCIRLHVADLVRLRHVLPGSPVDIVR